MPFTYPKPIADNAIDLTPAPPEFQQSFSDTVGNAGTDTDGFWGMFGQVVSDLAAVPNLHAGLDSDLLDIGSATGDLNTPWEQNFSDTVTGTIVQGDPDFQQYNVDITGNTPPAPTTPPTSGGTQPISQSAKCGTYGDSTILLSDPTGNCFAAYALPKVNAADGACTFPIALNPGAYPPGPAVSAVSQTSGDSSVWSATHDTIPDPGNAGMVIHRVLFTITPTKTGHFFALFSVTTTRSTSPEQWCMIVDIFGTASGSTSGGGGTPSGGGGGTPNPRGPSPP